MPPSRTTRRLRTALIALTLLGSGLWLAGTALWQLGRTAVYVHESVVVTGTVIDVRQKPFESWEETLGTGNWSWPGDVSYQPIVRFTLPGGIDAIRLDLEADNMNYHTGDAISIISPPGQPGKAHINRWKFLWGASCLRLGIGSLLTLSGYGILQSMKVRRPAPAAPEPPRQQAAPTPAKPARRSKGNKTANSSSAPRSPRKRKKAESSAAEQAKPRRSRKKKAAEASPELPL